PLAPAANVSPDSKNWKLPDRQPTHEPAKCSHFQIFLNALMLAVANETRLHKPQTTGASEVVASVIE
ncbi:MAG: hypothetical protein O3B38_06430, partial [Chloroflexi bacterium]|nr:hypothetical protein [Chloroflexota bacterium]